jgi:RHS repeat-associated protein
MNIMHRFIPSTALHRALVVLCAGLLPALAPAQPAEEDFYGTVTMVIEGGVTLNGSPSSGGYRMVELKPWKTYVAQIAGTHTLIPPNGYTLFINGVERRDAPSGVYYNDVQLRPRVLFAPDKIGEATGVRFATDYAWGVSLGTLINGQSAGHIFFNERAFLYGAHNESNGQAWGISPVLSPDCLVYTKESDEITVVMSGSRIQQIKARQGLANIVSTGLYSYEIRFYRPEDTAEAYSGAPAHEPSIVSGTPFAVYRIEPNVYAKANPEDEEDQWYNVRGLRLTKTVGTRTDVAVLEHTGGSPSDSNIRLTTGNGARIEERSGPFHDVAWYDEENEITHYDYANPYVLHVVKNSAGVIASKTKRYYKAISSGWISGMGSNQPWGPVRLLKKIEGPDMAQPLTTLIGYDGALNHTDLHPGVGPLNPHSYGRIVSTTHSDGNFARYDYYADADRLGQLWREIGPVQDTPATLNAIGSPTPTGSVTTYDYAADWTGRKVLLSSVETNQPNRRRTTQIATNGSVNNQPLNETVTRHYANGTDYEESRLTYFRRHLWTTVYVHLLYVSDATDGRRVSYAYHKGDYNSSTHTFSANESTGKAWRETAIHGWYTSPGISGSTMISALEDQTIGTLLVMPGKSVKAVTYRDTEANVVRTETYVFTSSEAWELIAWTNFTYNDASRVVSTTNSKGETTETEWTDGRKTAEIGATGIRTEYTYDALNRIVTATKKGVAAGSFPAQADIVTTYAYDAAGRVLSETVTGGGLTLTTTRQYDQAGRLTQSVEPGGFTTTYAYANSGRTVTVTQPDGATRITDHYLDRTVKSVTGTAGVASYRSVAGNTETIYLGAVDSERLTETTRDWLGRSMLEKPNALLTRTSVYNTKGQLISAQNSAQSGLMPKMATAYNAYGEAYRAWVDHSEDGELGTTEHATETAKVFAKEGSDWWAVKADKIYADGATTPTTTGTTKERLSGFTAGIVAESKVIDIFGNVTVKTVELNRTTKTVVQRTTFPDSSVAEEVTSVNGLTFKRRTKANLVYESRFDALGRVVQEIDPRTGTATTAYLAGTSRVSSRTNAAGHTTAYTYDSMGRVLTEQNPTGKFTRYAYTARGEVWRTWGDATYPVEYTYDTLGQKTHMRTYRGGSGWTGTTWPASPGTADTTEWTYHAATGQVASKIYPTGNTVQFAYNANGQMTSKINARGQTVTFAYDYNHGAPLMIGRASSASGASIYESLSFNRRGMLASVAEASGTRSFTYAESTTLQLTAENLSAGNRRLTPTYATTGVVGRATGFQLGTAADPDADQAVAYGYDTTGRLASVGASFAGGAARTVDYSYLAQSNLLSGLAQTSANFAVTRLYEAQRDLLTTTSAAVGSAVKAAYTYAYDNLGRRTSVIQTGEMVDGYAGSSPGLVEKYTYNDRSELLSANTFVGITTSATLTLPGRDYGYAYDAIGNRSQTTVNGRTAAYTANANNQYTARAVPGYYDVAGADDPAATVTVNTLSTDRRHQYFYRAAPFNNAASAVYGDVTIASSVNGSTTGKAFLAPASEVLTYDADGNLKSDSRWTYTWDAVNRLTKMETLAAAVSLGVPNRRLEFAYDFQDRRVQKKVYLNNVLQSDTRFIYDGWNVVAELDAAGAVTQRYVWGIDFSGTTQGAGGVGGLLMVGSGSATYLAAHDGRGNVTALVDAASGTLSASYEYSPFGETLRESGSAAALNPWRYSSKYLDAETGLVQHNTRYYSPSQGRFLGRDSIEEQGGLNLYAYCRNEPIGHFDLFGRDLTGVDMTSTILRENAHAARENVVALGKAMNFDSTTPMLVARGRDFLANAEDSLTNIQNTLIERYRRFFDNSEFETEEDAAIAVALRIAVMPADSRSNYEYGAGIVKYLVTTDDGEVWRYSFTEITSGNVGVRSDGSVSASWDGTANSQFAKLLAERSSGKLGDVILVGQIHSHPLVDGYGGYSVNKATGTGGNLFSRGDLTNAASRSIVGDPNAATIAEQLDPKNIRPYSSYLLMPNGSLRVVDGAGLRRDGIPRSGPAYLGSAVAGSPNPVEMLQIGMVPRG